MTLMNILMTEPRVFSFHLFWCKKPQVSGRLLNTDVMFIVKRVVGCGG